MFFIVINLVKAKSNFTNKFRPIIPNLISIFSIIIIKREKKHTNELETSRVSSPTFIYHPAAGARVVLLSSPFIGVVVYP